VSSIFALLASGGLRVQTQQQTPNIYVNGQLQKNGGLGDLPFDTTQTDPSKPSSIFQWKAKGGLGDAIASEMRMKPPGSDLVIANSSETVIPAAGGNGMMDFVEVLRSGFNAMVSTYKGTQQKQENVLNSIRNTLVSNQQQTNARLQKLETKFATPGMGGGGLGGAAAGGVDAFTPIAQRMGLTMTSGYRPGDPGWHGANRARDFSNGTGPTPQMMQFAQYMASTYGSNLKELIYTPLGFSIKNGQKVAPYAQGSHYNHVHVAYAMGLGNGMAFNSLRGAQAWEKSMTPGSVRVASVTGNSAEGFGTSIQGGINVTVNAGNISDPDTLADVVAQRILSEMQNTDSIFV
jgi:formiminotetrahydrofolate cyclodeaminase